MSKDRPVGVIKRSDEDYLEDELDAEEIKEKRRELQRLRLEKEILRLKAETEKARQELERYRVENSGSDSPSSVAAMVASLIKAGVSPEQANEFFSKLSPETVAVLSALASNNPYLPFLVFTSAQSRNLQAQSITPKDVIEINKTIIDAAEKLVRKGGEGYDSVMKEIVGFIKELAQGQLVNKLDELRAALATKRSVWDEILEDEKRFQQLRELFSSEKVDPSIQLQLEQLRQQHEREMERLKWQQQLEMRKLDLELLKLRKEIIEGKRRAKMLAASLRGIGEAIGAGMAMLSTGGSPQGLVQGLKCPKCGGELPAAR
ncbi:MAG: hypothetical protein QXK94_10575, partial [Candidatus Jordarchaeales archaeon]